MKKSLVQWQTKAISAVSVIFVIFALLTIGFVKIADEVTESETKQFDETVLHAIHGFASHTFDTLAVITTDIGGWMVLVWGAVLLAIVARKMRWDDAIIIAAGLGGAEILNLILKALFARPRPELWERLIVEQSFSFPSGHAMASSALAFIIMLLMWRSRWRWWAVGVASTYMIYIGMTRLYLGVHYPTDIIAGWCVSGAWVALVGWCVRYFQKRRSNTATQSPAHDS